ncbi:MAG: hypothetical protein ACL7BU_12585 [Candidatus Phlomobacter fragariae]
MQHLADIDNYTNQIFAARNLFQKLQQGLFHFPRYAVLMNKLSHPMQLVSIIQLIFATQSTIMQLNNVNLADHERSILENNLIVARVAGITNFSA